MKHFELEIEHHYKNKFIGRHRIPAKRKSVVLGQSQDADIRLLGDDVGPIHACLEFADGAWSVLDVGSGQGTWIQKKPITNEKLNEQTVVNIGGHSLRLTPHIREYQLYTPERIKKQDFNHGHLSYHQIIVKKNDAVKHTELISPNASFHFRYQDKDNVLPAPQGTEIKTTVFGEYTVIQELVKSDELLLTAKDYLANLKKPEMRAPLATTLMLLLLAIALIVLVPHKPDNELADMQPNNKYTRMIFDAKLVKKKRAEAKEMRKSIAGAQSNNQAKNTLTTPIRSKGAAPKVVSNLKLSGLTALLGKISKRANKNGPSVLGFGKTADNANTGHATAISSMGSLQGAATGAVGNGGETFKVGGVGTLGKGGGARGLAGIGGLAAGGAGTGTVGILDEETEIDGGLDKEVIARVISNYLGQIRYCYERQLSAEPDIYGKVQVKFTIDANGSVLDQRVGSNTLKNSMVEGCILRRLAGWKFPKPKGGTQVLVSYPFMFKATN